MDGYISTEELKATLELTNTNFADGDIPKAIKAASRGIDRACNRTFVVPDEEDTTRVFTPRSHTILFVDDLVEITTVELDKDGDGTYETTWTGTNYSLSPKNATAKNLPVERLLAKSARGYCWPKEIEDSVRITGRFGWPEVPDEVVQATTILSSKLLLRARQAPFGIITVGADVGAVARIARTDPDVAWLLDDLILKHPF